MRHQLCTTLPSRSYSFHRRTKALITPSGLGTENGGKSLKYVRPNHKPTTTAQAKTANIQRVRGATLWRILNRFGILRYRLAGGQPQARRPAPRVSLRDSDTP